MLKNLLFGESVEVLSTRSYAFSQIDRNRNFDPPKKIQMLKIEIVFWVNFWSYTFKIHLKTI